MKNAWRSLGLNATLIVLVTLTAYTPALRCGFVWDDNLLITANRFVRASDGLRRFWLTTEAPDYWPLTSTVWWLEWRLWDGHATGYHVVNVLLHAANAVLVWAVLQRLRIPGAWLAGLVFAIHPVNVATVAWISEQKNTLSMLFYAVAILLYLRFDEESQQPRTSAWAWYGLSLAAFLLSLLSKTAVVMLPVVLLGCVWWRRGKVRREDFLRSVPFFVLSLVSGLVTVWFHYHRVLGGRQLQMGGFAFRLAAAGRAPWFYLYKALVPLNLTAVYPRWQIDGSRWLAYLPGMILVGCLALFWWKRRTWGRPLFFGLGYFVVMLFPVLGFFSQSFHRLSWVADHWQYHSIVGVIALVAAGGEAIGRRMGKRARMAGALAGGVVLLLLGAATWSRSCIYADNKTLWQDNLAKNPNSWAAHTGLGSILMRAGKVQEAIAHYEEALRMSPDLAEVHNNLGSALLRAGKVQEAVPHIEEALRINPNFAWAHYNLGLALAEADKVQAAIGHYEQAVRINPDFAEAHNNLGSALVRAGKVQAAISHFEEALQIRADYAEAHYNLGIALEHAGRPEKAIEHYEKALQIKPGFAEAQNNLARLRVAQ